MKKNLLALIAGASLMLAGAAHAGVVGFEDLATGGDFAGLGDISPYAGLSWSADWYAGDTGIDGYAGGAHTGAHYAVNGFGSDEAGISSATAFSFAGAWFAAPNVADAASWVNVRAYDASNHLIGSTGNVAIGAGYVWVAGGFNNVARLSVTRDSGWYVMDDISVGAATPVPEPSAPLMLGAGLLMLGLGRRVLKR